MFKINFYVLLISISIIFKSSLGDDSASSRQKSDSGPSFKFHNQDEYKLVHHRVELVNFNKSIVSSAHGCSYPYNRTIRAINVTIAANANIEHVKVHAQVYKFMSNEYRYFPITIEFDYCTAVQEDFFDFGSMRKCGNMAKTCSYVKGKTYNFCNWVPDTTKFPPHIPVGDYKIELDFKFGRYGSSGVVFAWYGSVVEKTKWT